MTIKECTQTKCSFHKDNGHPELCPICNECGSESQIVDDGCTNCWNCLKDIGYVRKGSHMVIDLKESEQEKDVQTIELINKREFK